MISVVISVIPVISVNRRTEAALGFGADQIRTLVSMATDSSHRVIMGKRASSRFLDCF